MFAYSNIRDKLKQIRLLLKDGKWKQVSFWDQDVLGYVAGLWYHLVVGNSGIYVMHKDWDNLIVLDACRYDLFKEVSGLNLEYKISRGSTTTEFLLENFSGRSYDNTVVVTANPFVDKYVKNSFHKVIPVWKYDWDEHLNTVTPQTMLRYALEAEQRFPDKRLIIWFMQPHRPFIASPELSPYGYKWSREIVEQGWASSPSSDPWSEVAKGNLQFDRVWNAYKANLEIVLPYAFECATKLKGKTIITSDHGNAYRRLLFPVPAKIAGHVARIYIDELIKVPWLVFESPTRKEIKTGSRIEEKRIKIRIRELKRSGRLS
ncbi:MAG: hypothetical protein IMF19_10245 [Proteobacteria bacterium]|nr:hypothetical protein [Pseudomonadota bacterium]